MSGCPVGMVAERFLGVGGVSVGEGGEKDEKDEGGGEMGD